MESFFDKNPVVVLRCNDTVPVLHFGLWESNAFHWTQIEEVNYRDTDILALITEETRTRLYHVLSDR